RVLGPGGILIITTPNLAAAQDRLRFLIGRTPRHVDCLHPYLRLHIRPFTPSSVWRLLAASGFSVSSLKTKYVGSQKACGRGVQWRRLAGWSPSLGGSLVVAARRSP